MGRAVAGGGGRRGGDVWLGFGGSQERAVANRMKKQSNWMNQDGNEGKHKHKVLKFLSTVSIFLFHCFIV